MITSSKMVFYNRAFIYGTLMATSVWVCMSLPLSVVGLAMSQEGISDKYILVAFIMHFLGMFLPSFFTGKLILSLGYAAVGFISVIEAGLLEMLVSFIYCLTLESFQTSVNGLQLRFKPHQLEAGGPPDGRSEAPDGRHWIFRNP